MKIPEEKHSTKFNVLHNTSVSRYNITSIVLELMAGYFKGDVKKTELWFTTRNAALGGISPQDMIRHGRYKQLEVFVREILRG